LLNPTEETCANSFVRTCY